MAKKDIKHEVQKKYPDFAEAVDGLSVTELEIRLSTYAKELVKIKEAKEADEKLAEVLELKAELEGPYKDAKKAVEQKSEYMVALIRDKGGQV
jgi:hypothetical protein